MIAAIYARKSTKQDRADEDKSVTRQVANAKAFAVSKGWMRFPVNEDLRIVSDDLWQKVQSRRADMERKALRLTGGRPPKTATKNLLAGLVTVSMIWTTGGYWSGQWQIR